MQNILKFADIPWPVIVQQASTICREWCHDFHRKDGENDRLGAADHLSSLNGEDKWKD